MIRLLFSVAIVLPLGNAATYTVKAGGGGDYTTIQACATAMASGDICTIYAGTYNEDVTVAAGAVGSYKTINANGSDTVVVWSFTTGSYTKIIGLHIQHAASPKNGACITIAGGASHVYITDNVISQCGGPGAMIQTSNTAGASFVFVQGNTLSYGCGTPASPDACHAMYAFGDHFLIENNDVSHVWIGFIVASTYTVIRNNNIHDLNVAECTSNPGCHMDMIFSEADSAFPAQFNLWEKNTGRNGIGSDTKGFLTQGDACVGDCHNTIIRFNDIAHFGSGGISDDNGGNAGVAGFTYMKSYNNTWVDTNSDAPLFAGAIYVANNSTHGSSFNEIFYFPFALESFNPYATDASTIGTFSGGHGLAYCTVSPCNVLGRLYNSGSFTDDPGNIIGDPKFANYAGDDFRLTAISPAIGAGTYLTTVAGGDSGSGTSLVLNDASFFQDGYGLVNADWIRVGASTTAQISSINYATNTITLTGSISRSASDPVYLFKDSSGNVVLRGAVPDIGAFQFQGSNGIAGSFRGVAK